MKRLKNIFLAVLLILSMVMANSVVIYAKGKIKSKSVSLSAKQVTMSVGDIATLTATMKPTNSTDKLKWSSSNKKVATVSSIGVVTALQEGTTTITVKTSSNKKAQCVVTVKEYLTEEEIQKMISDTTISEETIKQWIKDSVVGAEEIKEIVAENSISEAMIKQWIAENTISEDRVKELIAENTISEATIKQWIAESSVASEGTDWEDGTELELHPAQTLPYIPPFQVTTQFTINDISVKKYHDERIYEGYASLYKYVIEINGTVDDESILTTKCKEDLHLTDVYDIRLNFINDSFSVDCSVDLYPEDGDSTLTIDGNRFELLTECYGNIDSDMYSIYRVSKVGYRCGCGEF